MLNICHELNNEKFSIRLARSSLGRRPINVTCRPLSTERDRNQRRIFSHHQPLIVLSQQWRTCRDFRPGERQWLIASTSTSSERAYNLLSTVTFYWFPRRSICRAIATRTTLSAAHFCLHPNSLWSLESQVPLTFFSAIFFIPYYVNSTVLKKVMLSGF